MGKVADSLLNVLTDVRYRAVSSAACNSVLCQQPSDESATSGMRGLSFSSNRASISIQIKLHYLTMTSHSFDSRRSAASFAKRVSKENKTTVRLLERDGKFFVEGDYPSSDQLSKSSESDSPSFPPTTLDYDSWIKERGCEKTEMAEEQWWQAYQVSKQIETVTVAVSMPSKVVKNIPEKKKSISLGNEEINSHHKSKNLSSGAGNSISEALKNAYISKGINPPAPIIDRSVSIINRGSSATIDKQKKRKKIPLKERGLNSLKIRLEKSVSDKVLEKNWRIEDARKKLITRKLLSESLENRVVPPPTTKIISTYIGGVRGAIVSKPTKQRENTICPRCGGDGGVNGGCGKCDGTGWI